MLRRISSLLTRYTPQFIAATAIVTFFLPSTFGWVRGDVQTLILGVIMLTMGMTLSGDDFRALATRPFDIAVGAVAQFVLMPGIAWTLVVVLDLPDGIALGLMLVGCCPGGVSSNIMSFLCKGDVAFSVGMTTVSTLLAPVMTPLLLLFLAGERIDIDAVGMFRSVLLVTIGPVAIGFLLNRIFSRRREFAAAMSVMPGIAVLGLAAIVGGVVSAQGSRFASAGWMIFVAVFIHNSLGYVLGYAAGLIARFSKAKKRTVAIEVGMQNAGLATVLATRHFPMMPEAAIAAAVSCVWHSVSGAMTAGVFNWFDRISVGRRTRVIVSLGSNLEPRADYLRQALTALSTLPETNLIAASRVIETEPVDVPKEFTQLKFFNQVAVFATRLTADEFSVRMHAIEDRLGRVRTVRNGPRTIDIDLIDFGGQRRDDPDLTLPHPRAKERSFVIEPLKELGILL